MPFFTRSTGQTMSVSQNSVDAVDEAVRKYTASNSPFKMKNMTPREIADVTDVAETAVGVILECSPEGQALVREKLVAASARGKLPQWAKGNRIKRRDSIVIPSGDDITTSFEVNDPELQDDMGKMFERFKFVTRRSGLSPKKRRKMEEDAFEHVGILYSDYDETVTLNHSFEREVRSLNAKLDKVIAALPAQLQIA